MRKQKIRERWIVKAGSQMVCSGGPLLIAAWMRQVFELRRDHGIEVIWVTSGAIAHAVDRTSIPKKKGDLTTKQALSAIGQPLVMDQYNLALARVGMLAAQVLLTYTDLAQKRSRLNVQQTLSRLLEWGAVPVLNENDAVASDEIQFGDNDNLSARVASLMKADKLVILTDVLGLFDKNPKEYPSAKLVPQIEKISAQVLAQTSPKSGTTRGTGGMFSKLLAAKTAQSHGIETWLVLGDRLAALTDIANQKGYGTCIIAPNKSARKGSKK